MKKILSGVLALVLLTTFSATSRAQCAHPLFNPCNLVDNGEFETYTSLPVTGVYVPGQINLSTPWTTANNGSPDYYNAACAAGNTFDVPLNNAGSEAAHGGCGYAGFASCYQPGAGNCLREYIREPLRCTLLAGVTYDLNFYVSLSDQSRYDGVVSAAVCTITPWAGWNCALTPACPAANIVPAVALTTPNKTGWTLVSYSFVATGGEQWIVIGNFNPTNPTVQTCPSCTWDGAYVYVDDISLSPQQSLTIAASPSSIPCGGTTTLTNNFGLPVDYSSPSGWSCSNCISATTPGLNATTTFSGMITYCTGCTQTATTTVTVSTLSVTASASPTTVTPPGISSSTLTATPSGGTGLTYSWSPAGSLSNPSASSPIATPTVTTTYTVTVTNAAGCSATATVTVIVNPQPLCTLVYDYDIPAGQSTSAYFSSMTGVSLKNIRIHGLFTVDSDFSFGICNIQMEPGSAIEVTSGKTLLITGQTHIYACEQMWNGINLLAGSHLQVLNSSIIEDAIKAVKVNTGSDALLNFSTFNRNYTAVEVASNAGIVSPVTMFGCVVTSRLIPFSATVSSNPTTAVIWSNIMAGIWPSVYMKMPYPGNKSVYGVYATDVNRLKIGSDGLPSEFNGFDNLGSVGIYLTRSNTVIYNNRFNKITNASYCLTCIPLMGNAIFATGSTTTNYSLTVGGLAANQPNTFTDIYNSVESLNYQVNTMLANTITNSSTVVSGYGGYGKLGIKITPVSNNDINVQYNSLTNCDNAIWINRNSSIANQTVTLFVDNNTITANASGFTTNGIYVMDYATPPTLLPTASEINFNTIIEGTTCINLLNVKTINDVISNSCLTRYASTGSRNGIKLVNCQQQNVVVNHTKCTAAPGSGGNILSYGIFLQNSPNNQVRCNLIEHAVRSLVFDGACTSTNGITQNTMRQGQDGLVLLTSGTVIGSQGTGTDPSNNYWDLSTAPVFVKAIVNNSTTLTLTVSSTPTSGPATVYPSFALMFGPMSISTTSFVPVLNCATLGAVPARHGASEVATGNVSVASTLFVYPNPTNGSFTLETYSSETKDVFVYDMMGRLIVSMPQVSDHLLSVDIADQPNGIYLVKVVSGNSVQTERIIKQ
jgi:hypothetical protein